MEAPKQRSNNRATPALGRDALDHEDKLTQGRAGCAPGDVSARPLWARDAGGSLGPTLRTPRSPGPCAEPKVAWSLSHRSQPGDGNARWREARMLASPRVPLDT